MTFKYHFVYIQDIIHSNVIIKFFFLGGGRNPVHKFLSGLITLEIIL